ncbi:putative leucine-rich repeat domain superfamily [Helianthus annuus]|nr:putative leucine-rich repeat domain superfamily [Helianthus annuus]
MLILLLSHVRLILCAVANAYLNRRLHVGDAGIVSLVTSCKNLIKLNLKGCIRVTDESLKAVGESCIRDLNLGGCYLITDLGLEYLADGDLKNCLQHLNLAECNQISDNGIIFLKSMAALTELSLSKCGVHVTDYAIADVLSHLSNIEILDLSWLINVTDISLLAIGSKCVKLQKIILTGCEAISAEGLRAFSGHQTLKRLELFLCSNFSWEDVESVALTCTKLEYLRLMKRIKTPTPEFSFDYLQIQHNHCEIDWDEDSDFLFR